MKPLFRLTIFAFIIMSVMYLFTNLISENGFSPVSDEGYYFSYAQKVSQKGLEGFKELVFNFSQDQQARLYPSPSRVGAVLSHATLFTLFGSTYFILGFFSAISFVLFLILNFHYVRKYFSLDIALLVTLFLSSSPLMLAMARRALIDSPLNLLWGACVWLLFDVLFERKAIKFIYLLIVFTLALLFKEGSLILLPFFILAIFIFLPKENNTRWIKVLLLCFLPLLLSAFGFILILGDFVVAQRAVVSLFDIQQNIGVFNKYVALYCRGPWYRYILDFVVLMPINTLLAIGYASYFFMSRKIDEKISYFLLYISVMYVSFNILQNNQVVRFVMNIEMGMSLLVAFALYEIFGRIKSEKRDFYITAAAMTIFIINFANFIHIFVNAGLLDPISRHLLSIVHIIP